LLGEHENFAVMLKLKALLQRNSSALFSLITAGCYPKNSSLGLICAPVGPPAKKRKPACYHHRLYYSRPAVLPTNMGGLISRLHRYHHCVFYQKYRNISIWSSFTFRSTCLRLLYLRTNNCRIFLSGSPELSEKN